MVLAPALSLAPGPIEVAHFYSLFFFFPVVVVGFCLFVVIVLVWVGLIQDFSV